MASVEICVTVENNNPRHVHSFAILVKDNNRNYSIVVCEIGPILFDEDEQSITFRSPSHWKEGLEGQENDDTEGLNQLHNNNVEVTEDEDSDFNSQFDPYEVQD